MLIDAPPTLSNSIMHHKHLSHLMAKSMNELAHKSPLICFCRPAVQSQAFEKHPSVHPFDLTVRKKKNIHLAVRLNRSKKICVRSPIRPCRSKKIYICSAVRLNRSKKNYIRSAVPLTVRRKFASVQPFNRSISNGLSNPFLSVRLPCIQPFERIS